MQGSFSPPIDSRSPGRVRRNPLDFAAIFIGMVIVALVVAVVLWQFWHANRIYSGVRIAGVPVGNMTRLEAMNSLNQKLNPYPLAPVSLTYEGEQWPLTTLTTHANSADSSAASVDLISAVNRAYLVGRDESIPQQLQEQLLALLIGINVKPQITFNRGQLRYAVALAAERIHRPARPAREIDETIVAGQAGLVVDVESTLQRLLDTLQVSANSTSAISAPLVVHEVTSDEVVPTPSTTETATDEDSGNLGSALGDDALPSIVLRGDDGYNLALDSATLASLLFSREPLRLDQARLTEYVSQWASQVNVEPRDARLQFNPGTGTVNILQTSMAGRALDIAATVQAIEEALSTSASAPIIQANLAVNRVEPAVDMNKIPELGIRELVASGTTYFAGSSAARVRNIEVAAAQFEGVVIPPGELFSFNALIEDVSAANGFEDSLIIWGDQTAVGVGGGVCQVSTTVFRAAYEAGLPIVERYNHGYVVDWYGEPGMDATIYTPTVDFKFRNDTSAHLLIDPYVDSINGTITFSFYGTRPNRQVIINDPIVSEVVAPEPPIYRVDEELALGEQEQVEWEKEGKTVEVSRTIIENGVSRTDTITSKYQPWQAVYLVGPGTLAEEPETTPEPSSE